MVGAGVKRRTRAEKALALWRQQRQGKADQVQAHFWAGRILLVSDKREAAAAFRKGLELDPDHAEMRFELAVVLTEYNPREAARQLEILHRQDPDNLHAAVGLASTLRGLGRLDRARGILEEVLEANPTHVPALLERGKTALDAGRPGEAEPFLRRALTLSPEESFVHLALSRCLRLTGRSADARYHENRYSEIESARTRNKRVRDEEVRDIWRIRLEEERAQVGGPSGSPGKNE